MADTVGYQVRPARDCDVSAVLELSRLWSEEGCTGGYVPCSAEQLAPWLAGGYFFVGDFQGEVVAYAAGEVKLGKGYIFAPEGEQFLNVDEVFVLTGHRDQGLGTRLVQVLLDKAEAAGIVRSMVGSNNVDWLATFRFYERHGYRMHSFQMYK